MANTLYTSLKTSILVHNSLLIFTYRTLQTFKYFEVALKEKFALSIIVHTCKGGCADVC